MWYICKTLLSHLDKKYILKYIFTKLNPSSYLHQHHGMKTLVVANSSFQTQINLPLTPGKDCSRFEFECQNDGHPLAYPQCIAIYDKCDGIVHCKDHSDENLCGGPEEEPSRQQGKAVGEIRRL